MKKKRFGIALVGIQPENDAIKLNAGPNYIVKGSDICFYMSITKEENSSLLMTESTDIPDEELSLTGQLTRRLSFKRPSFSTCIKINLETKPLTKSMFLLKFSI